MAFYLIGLGLDLKSISLKSLEIIKNCNKIYLENYTVNFPYNTRELEKFLKRKVSKLNREEVESEKLIEEAKKEDIALLVYGDPLSATTHISLILNAKKNKVNYKIMHSESILTAVSESGLQLYKFGKTTSMPKFSKNFQPDSFLDVIKQNQKINAHTLLLTDIDLTSQEAIEQLNKACKKKKMKLNKIAICSRLGTKQGKIYYNSLDKLINKKIAMPFCIIIPSELHFIEKEALNILSKN